MPSLLGDLDVYELDRIMAIQPTAVKFGSALADEAALVDFYDRASIALHRDRVFHRANVRFVANDLPSSVVPGDVAALRSLHVLAMHIGLGEIIEVARNGPVDETVRLVAEAKLPTLSALSDAEPFWLPAYVAETLLVSVPPDDQLIDALRLPYASQLVFFGAPLRVEPGSAWLAGDRQRLVTPEFEAFARALGEANPAIDELHHKPSRWIDEATKHGVVVSGLVLFADETGHLEDPFLVLMGVRNDEGLGFDLRVGSRRGSALAPAIENAAAMLAWGAWRMPDEKERFTGDERAARDTTRGGHFRRVGQQGELFGVRTLDVERTNERARDATKSDRSVAPHLRRGHWRRVRCGPRTDWHYEGRWIPPTFVAGKADPDPRERVYRLADPPSMDDIKNLSTGDVVDMFQ